MARSTKKSVRRIGVAVDRLEDRRLFSVSLAGGTVIVVGTNQADHVTVSRDAATPAKLVVDLNGVSQSFDAATVTGFNINLRAGNDTLTFDETNGAIAIPATVFGGGGNDSIVTGSGNDVIYGGAGNDSVSAGAGDDSLFGGEGKDSLDGGSGDDVLDGGAGNDSLTGGADSDTLLGGAGSDKLAGNGGDDDLNGGAGRNLETGGLGADAFALNTGGKNTIADATAGLDHTYKAFPVNRIPPTYVTLFHSTFPNSVPLGYRINDDSSFTMLYRYNGDNTQYHAFFTYPAGTKDPFADFTKINLIKYEVAPDNIPPNTLADFRSKYPDGDIKEAYADHDANGKFAMIRIKIGTQDSEWIRQDWLDDDGGPTPGH
ncbi:MAG: hem peroxidase [Phycisphaerales bacterium]|nr:hem peroxidase [Phycisphaerales bacterium]